MKTDAKGQANIGQMYQRRIIRMELYVTLKNKDREKNADVENII